MAVPKKRTSRSKKRIRRNIWIKKGKLTGLKGFSPFHVIDTEKSFPFWNWRGLVKDPWNWRGLVRDRRSF